jgi:hypothetical protein
MSSLRMIGSVSQSIAHTVRAKSCRDSEHGQTDSRRRREGGKEGRREAVPDVANFCSIETHPAPSASSPSMRLFR